MKAIAALNPTSPIFLDPSRLQPMAQKYGLDVRLLTMETILAKRTFEFTEYEMENTSDLFLELTPLKSAYPNLHKAVQIAMTICVSTAQCERSFSALKQIKSNLRSTMGEERLNNLAILSIEKELVCKLSLEQVVDNFSCKERRIALH